MKYILPTFLIFISLIRIIKFKDLGFTTGFALGVSIMCILWDASDLVSEVRLRQKNGNQQSLCQKKRERTKRN